VAGVLGASACSITAESSRRPSRRQWRRRCGGRTVALLGSEIVAFGASRSAVVALGNSPAVGSIWAQSLSLSYNSAW